MTHLISALFFLTLVAFAESSEAKGTKVRHLTEGQQPASAKLADLLWMQGHWKGNFFDGGTTEHILPNPVHKQLPGLVRFYKDTNWGNEITLFVEREGSVDYIVRHFDNALIALEPADKPIVRKLIAIEGNHYYFDGITFVNESPTRHTVYFEVLDGDRKGELLIVDMVRQ